MRSVVNNEMNTLSFTATKMAANKRFAVKINEIIQAPSNSKNVILACGVENTILDKLLGYICF